MGTSCTQHPPGDSLATLVSLTSRHVPSDAGGISRSCDGEVVTLASTHAVVDEADRLQTHLEDGPAVSPDWPSAQLVVDCHDGSGPWPAWTQALLGIGISRVLSTQILAPTGALGALTLYYTRPAPVADHQLELAMTLAQQAATQIDQAQTITQLTTALDTRTCIGQAQGILMERYSITPGQAFDALRRFSQDTNTKLRDVADELIAHGRLPGDVTPRPRHPRPAPPVARRS